MPSRPALAALFGIAAGAALPALVTRATKAFFAQNVDALRRGDISKQMRVYTDDSVMVFPGDHSWSGTYRGRKEIEDFLQRFVDLGLRGEIGEVWVKGPPWNQKLAVEFNDHAVEPDGTIFYENRAMIVATVRWGKLVREEVYEDSQKVAAWDAFRAERDGVAGEAAVAAVSPSAP